MSDDKLLGELVAFRRYTEEALGELKSDVKALRNWKAQVLGGAAVIAFIITVLFGH